MNKDEYCLSCAARGYLTKAIAADGSCKITGYTPVRCTLCSGPTALVPREVANVTRLAFCDFTGQADFLK